MKAKNESDQTIAFLKSVFQKMLALKYVYIAALVIFIGVAYIYNKYSPKVYEINTTIGPLKDTRSSVLASNDMFRGGGYSASSSGRDLETAINSLSSFALVYKTVDDLNLEIGYFASSKGVFKQYTEVYLQSPFIVTIDKSHVQTIGVKFYISILSNSSFRISSTSEESYRYNYIENILVSDKLPIRYDTICKFNETISNRNFKFSIAPNPQFFSGVSSIYDYYFELYDPEMLAKAYMGSLSIKPVSILASIINIRFSSTNLQKSLSFLNSYVNSFLNENLAKKNKIALNTIRFIDSQIADMSDSLAIAESSLRNFRTDNQVLDLSYQGQQIYGQMTQLETDRTNMELQSRYYNYVLNYFKTNQDIEGVTPPTSANITDPILNGLIAEIISLNAEKSTITNNNEKNLFSAQIDNKIKAQKQAIIDNVTNSLNTLNLTLNDLKYKEEKLSKDMSNLPRKEMNMVDVQRDFDLNNSIYTYLLQKKAESAITLSSNYPDYEVIEPARAITSKLIRPREKMNYFFALFFALLFPTAFIFVRDFFNVKVTSTDFIEHLINRSVIGIVHKNGFSNESVVAQYPRSSIAESFRNIRSSLFYNLKDKPTKVILISSAQPRDGKSFVSFNLASSIASVGNKTIILDCDLHKPTLHIKFNEENSSGLSNYITDHTPLEKIIRKTSVRNLSFIPAGPLLENPSELIQAGVLDDLFEKLKNDYEYVIIDSTPLGVLTDAKILMKYASQLLIVCRNNYTRKDIMTNIIDSLHSNHFDNFEVVFNDQHLKESPYSQYTSYYKKD